MCSLSLSLSCELGEERYVWKRGLMVKWRPCERSFRGGYKGSPNDFLFRFSTRYPT